MKTEHVAWVEIDDNKDNPLVEVHLYDAPRTPFNDLNRRILQESVVSVDDDSKALSIKGRLVDVAIMPLPDLKSNFNNRKLFPIDSSNEENMVLCLRLLGHQKSEIFERTPAKKGFFGPTDAQSYLTPDAWEVFKQNRGFLHYRIPKLNGDGSVPRTFIISHYMIVDHRTPTVQHISTHDLAEQSQQTAATSTANAPIMGMEFAGLPDPRRLGGPR